MLLSMTGFGAASETIAAWTATVEIKTVNNRYFKLSPRLPEGFGLLENRIETVIRSAVGRGTINLTVHIRHDSGEADYRLNATVLKAYADQLAAIDPTAKPALEQLLKLPGVVEEAVDETNSRIEQAWSVVEKALNAALDQLRRMRIAEGKSMADDLNGNLAQLAGRLAEIEKLAPDVVESYRTRLTERVGRMMQEKNLPLEQADLVREVALFADRADISEETVRLHSHLGQFRDVIERGESVGRKLDFLTQELFREANTIGSKANDARITNHVVEMKTIIERIREMVQNVE